MERSATEITLRPFNGDLRILSFKDSKPGEEAMEDVAELPDDMGAY